MAVISSTSDLKMIFGLSGSTKTHTLSLREPNTSLTRSQVNAAAAQIVGSNVIKVDTAYASELKDAYIQTTTKQSLE